MRSMEATFWRWNSLHLHLLLRCGIWVFSEQRNINRCPPMSTAWRRSGAERSYTVTGDSTPKPIAWGTFKEQTRYPLLYLQILWAGWKDSRAPENAAQELTELHPDGKSTFHVVTYNKGNLLRENNYADNMKAVLHKGGFEPMLNLNMERGGPWEETGRSQTQQKLSKLLSRLLRPMENWWTLQQTSTRPWGSLVWKHHCGFGIWSCKLLCAQWVYERDNNSLQPMPCNQLIFIWA